MKIGTRKYYYGWLWFNKHVLSISFTHPAPDEQGTWDTHNATIITAIIQKELLQERAYGRGFLIFTSEIITFRID